MESIEKQLHEMNKLQNLQQRSHWMNDLHPLGKLLVSVVYIFMVASFHRYNLQGLILMAKVYALLDGRTAIGKNDIARACLPVMRHRIALSFEARMAGETPDSLLLRITRAAGK